MPDRSQELVVLDKPERTLDELATAISQTLLVISQAFEDMREGFIDLGNALLEAREQCEWGAWMDWASGLGLSLQNANMAVRCAVHADVLRESGSTIRSLWKAQQVLAGLPETRPSRPKDPTMHEQLRYLRDEGLSISEIADTAGVSDTTVRKVVDPEYNRRVNESNRRREAERRMLRHEAEQRRQRNAARSVARKAGGARTEAYAMGERFQDVIAQAQREEDDREAREAWSRAGELSRKLRDEIVHALALGAS
jgi:hypothetical protein